nr:hypothetical protein CFP56_48832 [Quercus suber]
MNVSNHWSIGRPGVVEETNRGITVSRYSRPFSTLLSTLRSPSSYRRGSYQVPGTSVTEGSRIKKIEGNPKNYKAKRNKARDEPPGDPPREIRNHAARATLHAAPPTAPDVLRSRGALRRRSVRVRLAAAVDVRGARAVCAGGGPRREGEGEAPAARFGSAVAVAVAQHVGFSWSPDARCGRAAGSAWFRGALGIGQGAAAECAGQGGCCGRERGAEGAEVVDFLKRGKETKRMGGREGLVRV